MCSRAEGGTIRPLRHGVTNMTVDDFRQSLTAAEPPAELTLALTGLLDKSQRGLVLAKIPTGFG